MGEYDAGACRDMAGLRANIDAIDRELMALFNVRHAHIERAGELKRISGLPARIPERVAEVIGNIRAEAVKCGIDPVPYERVWREIIETSIALEERRLAE